MPLTAPCLLHRWKDALPRAWRRLLPFVVVLAALAATLSSPPSGQDPLRQAGWERQNGEFAVLREPETIRILRREVPDNRDRGGPGADDTAFRPVALHLYADLTPVAPRSIARAPAAAGRRMARPEPRAPPSPTAA